MLVTAFNVTQEINVKQWTFPNIPIGKPGSNIQFYVVDTYGNRVPIGVPGELYIGGVQIPKGYLNNPEKTRQSFIINPFGSGVVYQSGDIVRALSNGSFMYLGRTDTQVKIRGIRMELGEIDSVIKTHASIKDSTVVAM